MKAPDTYTFCARVVPVLVVVLAPLVLLGSGLIAGAGPGIATGLVTTVVAAIAGQLGRDRGKALEPGLWASWNGSPTRRRLRYRNNRSDQAERLHARIERVLSETLPTAAEEAADEPASNERYDEITRRLIGLTRDHDQFGLLFAENCNYGQRRNLLGLRTIGIIIAAITAAAAIALLVLATGPLAHKAARYGPAIGVALLELGLWIWVVRAKWVRIPAEAYADRLMEAVDLLDRQATAAP
jgi:hypothetical protein